MKNFSLFFLMFVNAAFSHFDHEESNREILDRFFKILICENEFGYTIFGEKPASIALTGFHSKEYSILKEGVIILSKIYPSEHFCVWKNEDIENEAIFVTIMNKKAALKIIDENLETFQSVYGAYASKEILHRISSSEHSIFQETDPPNQLMIGLLLGYGKKNAELFQKRCDLIYQLKNRMIPPFSKNRIEDSVSPLLGFFLQIFDKTTPINKNLLDSLSLIHEAEEVVESKQTSELTGSHFLLEKYVSPRFAAWDEEETVALKQSYMKTREKMRLAYREKDFLKVTLDQWIK